MSILGNNTIGGNSNNLNHNPASGQNAALLRVTAPSDITVDSISGYFSGSGDNYLAIWDSSFNLLANSSIAFSVLGTGWATATYSGTKPVLISGDDYYIGYVSGNLATFYKYDGSMAGNFYVAKTPSDSTPGNLTDTSNSPGDGGGLTGSFYISYSGAELATVDTAAATDLTDISATLNGEITDVGSDDADERGFVWGTSTLGDPGNISPGSSGYDDFETDSGSFSAGVFDYPLTGLTPDITYYVRAYAHNSGGYSYGDEVSFDTNPTPSFRFTNLPGIVYDPTDTTTIYAERLNDILDRLDAGGL